MQLTQRTSRVLLAVAAVAVLVAAVVVIIQTRDGGGSSTTGSDGRGRGARVTTARIPASGGIALAAQITTPSGNGPFPLVIMPASWGSNQGEYSEPAQLLAGHGYQVVAYAQRGFKDSGGAVDFGATTTQGDSGTVIDWALAHTHADRSRIAMVGISYGAGISLLAASRDRRIRAVVAMSTWSDFAGAFLTNDTLDSQALGGLVSTALSSATPGPAITGLAAAFKSSIPSGIALLRQMSAERSPDALVAGLNRNRPAVMIANNLEDSVFAPAPVIDYFDRITAPKRLELGKGDHGGAEYGGVLGRPNAVWSDALGWLDHYLRGMDTTVARARPVQFTDVGTGGTHSYATVPTRRVTARLGPPSPDGTVGAEPSAVWSQRLPAGVDSAATSGQPNYQGTWQPPTIATSALSAQQAAVWNGATLNRATLLTGTPALHVRIGGSGAQTTVYVYLYDVDASGTGRLITFAPDTVRTDGGSVSTTVPLEPTCWTVAAGHHVTAVVDTVDPRFTSMTPTGSTVTVSSTAADPATISLPVD